MVTPLKRQKTNNEKEEEEEETQIQVVDRAVEYYQTALLASLQHVIPTLPTSVLQIISKSYLPAPFDARIQAQVADHIALGKQCRYLALHKIDLDKYVKLGVPIQCDSCFKFADPWNIIPFELVPCFLCQDCNKKWDLIRVPFWTCSMCKQQLRRMRHGELLYATCTIYCNAFNHYHVWESAPVTRQDKRVIISAGHSSCRVFHTHSYDQYHQYELLR